MKKRPPIDLYRAAYANCDAALKFINIARTQEGKTITQNSNAWKALSRAREELHDLITEEVERNG